MTYVHQGAPPFHIAHGDADRFVPAAQSRQLTAALRDAGVAVEFTEVRGADHLWMGTPDPETIFDAAVDFARRATPRSAVTGPGAAHPGPLPADQSSSSSTQSKVFVTAFFHLR